LSIATIFVVLSGMIVAAISHKKNSAGL